MARINPEKKFNEDVWYVLQDIKEESFRTETNKPIEYTSSTVVGGPGPYKDDERKIIFKLQEWKAIKIVKHVETSWQYNNKEKFLIHIFAKSDFAKNLLTLNCGRVKRDSSSNRV